MKNKFIPMTISAVLALSACAPQKETVREIVRTEKPQGDVSDASFLPFWEQIAAGNSPNPALAGLLIPYLSEQDRAAYLKRVAVDDSVLSALESDRQMAKNIYLLQTLGFRNDPAVLNFTLNYRYNQMSFSAKGIRDDFNLNLQIQKQNQAMDSLLKTYSERAQKVAIELMPAYIQQLSPEDQKKLSAAVKGPRAEAIENTVEILKRYDKILAAYNFHNDDNTKLIVIGLVAGAVVDHLAKQPSIQELIKKAREVGDVVAKVREAASLVQLIQDSRQKMGEDWQSAKGAMEAILQEIKKGKWELEFRYETRVESLRLMSDALTGNLQSAEGQGPLSEPQAINKNIETFVNSAASAAGRLDTILNATEKLAVTLGIKIDPGVQQAIDTARTVASVVNLTQSVMSAYASGGLIGAMGMMAGGPGPALMGAVSGAAMQAEMAADLKAIRRELAEIKQLQKQMIEIQLETMKMIRELAVVVESYHKIEMRKIEEIKSVIVQNIEAQRLLTHAEINSCEKMIQYGVSMNAEQSQLYRLGSVRTFEATRQLLKASLQEKGALVRFARSSGESNYETCQRSMTKAFGSKNANENPVQFVANFRNDELATFHKDVYQPLVEALQSTKIIPYSVMFTGLHLPAVNADSLRRKVEYAVRGEGAVHGVEQYDLINLISTEGLERYVENLLVLHPILSYDKADWLAAEKDANTLKERYNISWARSHYWLENALSLVQSAIAQESLMVGEPLMLGLADQFGALSEVTECAEVNAPNQSLACAVRRNRILNKNLLTFVIRQRIPVEGLRTHYQKALSGLNAQALELTLGLDFAGKIKVKEPKTKEEGKEKYLVLSWPDKGGIYDTRLPSPDEVIRGEIVYTDNMKRLMVLQDKLVEAYLEVTPMAVDEKVQRQVRRMTLQK
ncbi:hypothetical protein [Bdellovibrio bacteriovorus]|uniref:Lipoprotein n=1 Tax=Bdellovibrio bacteriovorus str. Tiberius TaxID=1069642 RepID=K7ZCK1_BDEBC|nr:hypothetical protein [Bdellovibrio bacteriovorus]AFY03284.1 hypothetical protein Bdt_3609 [Bdellovibrio bacteriovorus str. Tiberius]